MRSGRVDAATSQFTPIGDSRRLDCLAATAGCVHPSNNTSELTREILSRATIVRRRIVSALEGGYAPFRSRPLSWRTLSHCLTSGSLE